MKYHIKITSLNGAFETIASFKDKSIRDACYFNLADRYEGVEFSRTEDK